MSFLTSGSFLYQYFGYRIVPEKRNLLDVEWIEPRSFCTVSDHSILDKFAYTPNMLLKDAYLYYLSKCYNLRLR